MERYIEQLIEDFREAAKQTPEPSELWDDVDMDNPGEVEDIAYVERFVYGTPQMLSEIVGIAKIQLPPVGRLSSVQTAKLLDEMLVLLYAYHFVPIFPDDLPSRLKYRVLRANWDSEQVYVGGGESEIEFCDLEPDECPYPHKFCTCRKVDAEIWLENLLSDDDDDWYIDESFFNS